MKKKREPLANPHYLGSIVEQLLATLIHRPGDDFTVNELAAYTGQSPASVARSLDQAIAAGAPLRTVMRGRGRSVSLTVAPDSATGEQLARDVLVRQGYEAADVIDCAFDPTDSDDLPYITAITPYGVRGEIPAGAVGFDMGDANPAPRPKAYLPEDLRPDESDEDELPGEHYPEQPGSTPTVSAARLLGAQALRIDDQLDLMDRALSLAAGTSSSYRTKELALWVRELATTIPQPGRVLLWAAAHAERLGEPHIGGLAAARAHADLTEAFKQLTAAREYLERCAGIGADIDACDQDLDDLSRQIEAATTDEHRAYLTRQHTQIQNQRAEFVTRAIELSGEIGGAAQDIGGDDERLLRAYFRQTIELCEGLAQDLPAPPARQRGHG